MSFKIIGLGEVLWDLLPAGKQLGGAPANFAYHARALGAEGRVVSRVGQDALGREVLERLPRLGLPVDTIEIDPNAPTGSVSVTLDAEGHANYVIHENAAWDNLAGETAARQAAVQADAICFGTLAQRREPARSTIRSLVRATSPGAWRILDVNLRQHYHSAELIRESLELANVLKVNETELPCLAEIFGLSGTERDQISELAARFRLRSIAFTRGGRGSLLYSMGRWSDHPGIPARIADTIGAGDSFTAAMTIGLLAGWDLEEINARANGIAAYVASQPGATPALPAELCAPFGR